MSYGHTFYIKHSIHSLPLRLADATAVHSKGML
jgi:hypothetical protein